MNEDVFSALDSLSEQEKQMALDILNEYSVSGYSNKYNELIYNDYEEIPVDIHTFLHNKLYLGKALYNEEGKFTLFPYWEQLLEKLYPDPLQPAQCNTLALTGGIGLGKAQPLDSLVLTGTGFKKMGDLTLSDKIYGNDGQLHNLIGIFPQGKKKICQVFFSDGTSARCCDEHLWTVYSCKLKKWITVETKDLIDDCNVSRLHSKFSNNRYKIPVTSSIEFTHKDVDIDPYQFGASLCDSVDANLTDKYIPDEYLYTDTGSRVSLLQGLMDTDGYTSKFGTVIEYNTISNRLKDGIVWLVQSLGGIATVKDKYKILTLSSSDNKKQQIYYNIDIRLPKNICPFSLSRKKEQLNDKRAEPQRYIESIEYVGEEDCQCIYIDSEQHLYLTNDFIVTHNSTIAVIIGLYELYRMLCLKDPYVHYGLQPIDLITFAVINITMDAAKGVAWNKLQSMIQSSEWFMSRGTLTKSRTPEWFPPKGIELMYGSQNRHVIGRAVFWCLDGDTVIKTSDGEFSIKTLVDKPIKVYNISENGAELLSDLCTVKLTGEFLEEYQIELEDGSVLKCTPNHRFMLKDGTYKEAKDLTIEDELFDIT